MIGWRRAAAWLGVVAQLAGMHSLGAQSRPEAISIAISGPQGNSIPPAPNIDVNGLNPQSGLTYSILLELSTEPAFARPFFVQSTGGLSARFRLDSLLTQGTTIYLRARLFDQFNVAAAETTQTHTVLPWLRLDTPAQQPLVILNTRRPLFAWSSPAITLLWEYDLTILKNTASGAVEQASYKGLSDTSFVVPDSLEANTSYSWRVTARGLNSTGHTEVTVKNLGTFAIQSSTQPTVTLFYQNFPNPFGRGERSDQTCFWFDLDRPATVRLTIFDIRLRRLRQIVPGPIGNGVMTAGSFGRSSIDAKSGCDPALTWDGRDDRGQFVPPGVYIAQFIANGKSTTIKIMYKGPP